MEWLVIEGNNSEVETLGDAKEIFESYLDTLGNDVSLKYVIEQTETARELIHLVGFVEFEFSLWLMERAREFINNKGHYKKG